MIFISEQFANELKNNINSEKYEDIWFELRRKAEKCLKIEPFSVTFSKSPAASGNIHDFCSEGPYWWQNPDDPDGPYIRRDGETNPSSFLQHRLDSSKMSETISYLALAGYYLQEKKFTDYAVKLLSVWFLDEETKMNPHLEYGQAIKGMCDGRGIGIIDTVVFVRVIYSLGFIEHDGGYKTEIEGLKKWFSDYLNWLDTSKKGIEERDYYNNHANWWNTQAAAYAVFIGDDEMLEKCFDRFRNKIIPIQTGADGSFTDEMKRTRSFRYSMYNLEACSILCELAHSKGVDLWNFKTADNKGMKNTLDFLLPYYENPFLWKNQQIYGDLPADDISFQLGGLRLNDKKYSEASRTKGKNYYCIRNSSFIGPLALLPGFFE